MAAGDHMALEWALPVPDHPFGATGDWIAVRERLGVDLPEDFVDFVTCYGTGSVSGFLQILSPFSTNENLNLFHALEWERRYQADRLTKGRDWWPFPVFPPSPGLLPWGVTDNGDTLYWRTASKRWSVIVKQCRGGPEGFEEFPVGFHGFVTAFSAGSLLPGCFPKGLRGPLSFQPIR